MLLLLPLLQVSAANASIVILLHPDGAGSPEALKAAAAMSLSTLQPTSSSTTAGGSSSSSKHSQQQRVIVQMPSEWMMCSCSAMACIVSICIAQQMQLKLSVAAYAEDLPKLTS
jgi:hypothetical protein